MPKNVLITGGVSGLGLVLSQWFITSGYNTFILDKIDIQALPQSFPGQIARYYQINLSDSKEVMRLINNTEFPVFDVFVMNAFPRIFKDFVDFTSEEIIDFANSGFTNQILINHTILKSMVVHNTGKVIIIGSKSALKGYSTGSLYCSLKMAHIGFFESVKKELKKCHSSVTVSLIHPDSFSSISKKHIDDSNPIIKKILVLINKIVNKDKFGQFYVFEWRTRLFLSSYFFLKMFNLIK